MVCNTKETLLYLVNQYVLTFHITLSKIDIIQNPDKLIFDIDPPKGHFELAIKAAKTLRHIIEEELGLKAYIMTTGSRGLHIATPIKPDKNFDEVHQFTRQVATYACAINPKEFTTAIRKDKREGRVYIDFIRNSYAQTSVSPFSMRAQEKAPIATPLSWDELNDKTLNAQAYTISSIYKRLETTGNPWRDFEKHAKSITSAKEKLEVLVS